MANNVIDSLVVTLGLDSKGFSEGIKGSTEQLASFTQRVAGMFLAVKSIEGVVDYFKNLHRTLAEVGFESRNLGVAGTEISRWGEVAELAGGKAQDAAASIEGLQASIFNLKYRGQMSDQLAMLQRFGVAYLDASGHMRDFTDIAKDAAAAIDRQARATGMDVGERTQLAHSFGFSGGIADAIAKGGKDLEENLKRAAKDQKPLTDKTIAAQVELTKSLISSQAHTDSLSSNILNTLTPEIEQVVAWLRQLADIVLPMLNSLLQKVIKWFENPPAWFQGLESSIGKLVDVLGPGGALIASIGALILAMRVGSIGLSLGKSGLGLGAGLLGRAAGPIGLGIGAGLGLDWLDEKFNGGRAFSDTSWLGSKVGGWFAPDYDPNAPSPSKSLKYPTPNAARPGGASAPAASNGGTTITFENVTVNSKGDGRSIANDFVDQTKRKYLVANSDSGLN